MQSRLPIASSSYHILSETKKDAPTAGRMPQVREWRKLSVDDFQRKIKASVRALARISQKELMS